MKTFQKNVSDETIIQICEIQRQILSEKSDFDSVRSLADNGVLFFVEFDDRQNVSCFCMVKPTSDDWEIYDVATIPEYQRCGLAKKIIKEVLDFAKEKNAKKIFLEVRESNENAIGLYSMFGFEKYAVRKNYYANNGENAVCMTKKL